LKLQALSLAALAVGVYIGLKLPDVDQSIGFLLHRSIITHGPLAPLLAFAFALSANPIPRKFGMGVCSGFAVHMAFDLFPLSWQGYALVSLPGYGWTPPVVSWILLAGTMLICMGLAVKLIRDIGDSVILLVALVATFVIAAGNESSLWLPLATIVVSLVIAYWMIKPTREDNRWAFK
jgi:uncharacterized membrane protein YhaH (DUF805 family)